MTTFRDRGRWRYAFQKNGKRVQGWWYATKKEAKAAEAEARKQFRTRAVTNTSLLDLFTSRLDALKRRSESHFAKNRRLLKNLLECWGKKKTVTRQDVVSYLAGNSNAKANRDLRLIRACFNHGLELGIWPDNPCKGVKFYPSDSAKRYVPPTEDIRKVLAVASEKQRLYLLVIIHTLSRVTAINTLKWADVHEDHLVLRTRKARNSNEKEVRVPLNDTLKKTLSSIPRTSEYVFPNPKTGRPYILRLKMIHSLCQKAGVPHFTYHALRHYGASRLVDENVPLTAVQSILGHEKLTTTAIYTRSLDSSVRDAIKKMEGI